MSDKKPTYDELVERNRRLANMIVRNNRGTEEQLRAEVKKAKAEAWEEGVNDQFKHTTTGETISNPYKDVS